MQCSTISTIERLWATEDPMQINGRISPGGATSMPREKIPIAPIAKSSRWRSDLRSGMPEIRIERRGWHSGEGHVENFTARYPQAPAQYSAAAANR